MSRSRAARPRADPRIAVAAVCMLACGSEARIPEPTGAALADTTSSGSESTSSADADSGDATCMGPFASAPATTWERDGLDDDNSRFNAIERAIDPESVACLAPRWRVDELAGVTSTPAVAGGTVYFGDWDGKLHARDVVDGAPRWVTELGARIDDSPLLTADTVYIGDADGFLHAIDRTSGAPRWQVELDAHRDAGIHGSPILAEDRIVVGVASNEPATPMAEHGFRGSVVALDPQDGALLWRRYTTGDDASSGAGVSVRSTPAYDPARRFLYVGTGDTHEPPGSPLSDALLALDLDSGAIVWSRQFTEADVYTILVQQPRGAGAEIGAAPNLFRIGERDVVGVGDEAGVYAVLDRDDGETVWAVQLTGDSHLGGVMATATVGDDTIWVASNAWVDDGSALGDPDDRSSMFALAADDGTIRWQRPLPYPALGATTWAAGVVYQGTIDGTVHALDAATGVELWSAVPGGPSTTGMGGGVSVVDGTLWVGHGGWFSTDPGTPPDTVLGGLVAYGLSPAAPGE